MKNQQMLRVILRNWVAQKTKPKSLGKEYKAVVGLKEDFFLG